MNDLNMAKYVPFALDTPQTEKLYEWSDDSEHIWWRVLDNCLHDAEKLVQDSFTVEGAEYQAMRPAIDRTLAEAQSIQSHILDRYPALISPVKISRYKKSGIPKEKVSWYDWYEKHKIVEKQIIEDKLDMYYKGVNKCH